MKNIKFGGPRGGHSTLFRREVLDYSPMLILTEGEWDAMLLWEHCSDKCDVGTIGGASAKFDALDLALPSRYHAILVVYDKDKAGKEGGKYIAKLKEKLKPFLLCIDITNVTILNVMLSLSNGDETLKNKRIRSFFHRKVTYKVLDGGHSGSGFSIACRI